MHFMHTLIQAPTHPFATASKTPHPFTFSCPSAATAALLVSMAAAMAAVRTRPRPLLMAAALVLQQPLLVMPPTCLEGGVAAPWQLCTPLLLELQVVPPLSAGQQVTAVAQLLLGAVCFWKPGSTDGRSRGAAAGLVRSTDSRRGPGPDGWQPRRRPRVARIKEVSTADRDEYICSVYCCIN